MTRTAVVLFNLGGPDRLQSVRPFLLNLFSDPAILRIPSPFRQMLAALISTLRAKKAAKIYATIGGRSPIVEQTEEQALALEDLLAKDGEFKVFYAMRYWHPRAQRIVREVKDYAPDRVVLLPLYPQFSSATTASSVAEWERVSQQAGLSVSTTTLCCYPTDLHFTAAYADLIRQSYFSAASADKTRILFSAHGLPKKTVDAGDPYQWQVEQSVKAIVSVLAIDDLDYVVCYQSRVGPLEWIGPSTEAEIERAGKEGVSLVVVPVSFVSEHSETLYELDIQYRALAQECRVPKYSRVPALSTHPSFIEGLAALTRNARQAEPGLLPPEGARMCPSRYSQCLCFNRESA